MSNLIDNVIKQYSKDNVLINGKWYVAKPLGKLPFRERFKDAILCLKGNAVAFHFKEDELKGGGLINE